MMKRLRKSTEITTTNSEEARLKVLILGGGISAVSCAEELERLLGSSAHISIVSVSRFLKQVALTHTSVPAMTNICVAFDQTTNYRAFGVFRSY